MHGSGTKKGSVISGSGIGPAYTASINTSGSGRSGERIGTVYEHGIAHGAPVKAPFRYLSAAFNDIFSHKRFAADGKDSRLYARLVSFHLVENTGKIVERHIGSIRHNLAVTAAMAASHVTPKRAFPKELLQRMG